MSKSGLAVLYELEVKTGVIDPDYTGNIGVVLKNNSQSLFERAIGEPIAQLLFIKVVTPKLVQVQHLTQPNAVEMASELTVPSQLRFRKRFKRGLQILLNTFHDAMLLYTQNIQIVNFSDIDKGIVNVIITYTTEEGRSVKFEALGEINDTYIHTLDFIWQAMQRAAQEAPIDYSGPFAPLTLPTSNDLLKTLPELLL